MEAKDRSASERLSIWLSGVLDNINLQDRVRDMIATVIRAVTFSCVFVLTCALALTVVPNLETQFYPVVTNWRADNYQRIEQPLMVNNVMLNPGDWLFDVYGRKSARSNCEYVPGQTIHALIAVDSLSPVYEGTITYLDDDTPDSTRPTNAREQYFGRWILTANPKPRAGAQVEAQVEHDCHLPWLTVTKIGPFILQDENPRP